MQQRDVSRVRQRGVGREQTEVSKQEQAVNIDEGRELAEGCR